MSQDMTGPTLPKPLKDSPYVVPLVERDIFASFSSTYLRPAKQVIPTGYGYLVEDIRARAEVGKAEYGDYLQIDCELDLLNEALKELADYLVYLRGAIAQRCDHFRTHLIQRPYPAGTPWELVESYHKQIDIYVELRLFYSREQEAND